MCSEYKPYPPLSRLQAPQVSPSDSFPRVPLCSNGVRPTRPASHTLVGTSHRVPKHADMAGLQADKDIIAGLAEANRDEFELERKGVSPTSSTHSHELDGIHDGLEFPIEEEKKTLRRVADTLPWAAYCQSSASDFYSPVAPHVPDELRADRVRSNQ